MSIHAPEKYYQNQLDKFSLDVAGLKKKDALIAAGRAIIFIVGIAIAVSIWRYDILPAVWLVLPVSFFIGLMVFHSKVIRNKTLAQNTCSYYQTGLQRLENHWQETTTAGHCYFNINHPYSADLDVFGKGSLFQLINFSQTKLGKDRLARWLSDVPEIKDVLQRQAAVQELKSRVELFEEYAMLYPDRKISFNQDTLEEWSQQSSYPIPFALRCIASVVGIAMFTSVSILLFGNFTSGFPALAVMISLFSAIIVAYFYRQRIHDILPDSDKAGSGLDTLAGVMQLIEHRQFQSEMLSGLKIRLETANVPSSLRISQLSRHIQNLNNSTRNQFFAPVSFALCLPIHFLHALEVWRNNIGIHVPDWLAAVAEFEALLSLARYTYEHPDDVFPDIIESGLCMEAKDLGHPLVDNSVCVRNDITLNENNRLIMISGSNMSGKSTLLRTIGSNAILAYVGAPVRASKMKVSLMKIGTAMRVQDSLQDGKSLFYAVLSRLKLVIELAGSQQFINTGSHSSSHPPLLFMLDEILHGTNSHDRRVGAEGIIKGLLSKNAIGLVTTHDLELTKIVDQLDDKAINIHFQDEIDNGQMTFDYKIYPGVVEKSNALELMKILGLRL